MAIKDEIDVMLNNLKNAGAPANKPKGSPAGTAAPAKAPAPRKTAYDSMSVDELLNELIKDKILSDAATEPAAAQEKPAAQAPAVPVSVLTAQEEPLDAADISRPVIADPPVKQKKKKKKRIVISGELPDYEALRQEELAREETARKAAEETEAERPAEEPEKTAAEEAVGDERGEASEENYSEDKPSEAEDSEEAKSGLFSKIKDVFSKSEDNDDDIREAPVESTDEEIQPEQEAAEETAEADTENSPASFSETDSVSEDMQSAAELVDAAIAAIEEVQLEIAEENAEDDPVEELIEDIRDEAASTIADIEAEKNELSDEASEAAAPETEAFPENETDIDISVGEPEKKGRVTAALERILNEDPDTISSERSEKTEPDEIDVSLEKKGSGRFKKHLYAVFGVIFTILAVVGLVTVVKSGIIYIRSFTAGESKMDSFTEIIYPAVIMDIDSFENPSELSSEQLISAALWSLVMSEEEMAKYEETFDVISVPAIDVEAYAAELFGSSLPGITHGTVGSGELKFYYNEETKAYNVPVRPITFTYKPSIKSVAKSGSNYTIEVDYINELPSWMKEDEVSEDSIAKTVEFRLTETNGQYHIVGMRVVSVNSEM